MNFNKFPKIENILKAYSSGYVPLGEYAVSVKMDGANAGIIKQDGKLLLHSRNHILGALESAAQDVSNWVTLKGFVGFVKERYDWFANNLDEGEHVYMEWLIPHTIQYTNSMYKKVYIFDPKFSKLVNPDLGIELVQQLESYTISTGTAVELYDNIILHVAAYLDSVSGAHKTEGMVFTNHETNERFKLIFSEFKEQNLSKFAGKGIGINGVEVALATRYPNRSYDKIIEKVKVLKNVEVLNKQHIPVVLGLTWHDYMTEFFIEAVKEAHFPIVNTKSLKSEFERRIRDVFISEVDTGIQPVWFDTDTK